MGLFDIFKKNKKKDIAQPINREFDIENSKSNNNDIIVDNNSDLEATKEDATQKKLLLVNKDGSWNLQFFVENNLLNQNTINYIKENCDSSFMPMAINIVKDHAPFASLMLSHFYHLSKEKADLIIEQLEKLGVVEPLGDSGLMRVIPNDEKHLYSLLNDSIVTLIQSDKVNDKENTNDYYELFKIENIVKYEYPRREQIYRESLDIIQNTNNIDTFLGRVKDITDYIDWISKNFDTPSLSKYINLSIDGEKVEPEIFWKEMNCMLNDNLVRIISHNYAATKNEVLILKQKKAKENRIVKLYESIEKAEQSIFKSENSDEIVKSLNEIHLSVDELYNEI